MKNSLEEILEIPLGCSSCNFLNSDYEGGKTVLYRR